MENLTMTADHSTATFTRIASAGANIAGLLLIILVLLPIGFAAKNDKKDHNDSFVAGAANESGIAKRVRHELLMLPYYGVFDDLAFRIDGDTVTLLGQVTRPTLKSDAE